MQWRLQEMHVFAIETNENGRPWSSGRRRRHLGRRPESGDAFPKEVFREPGNSEPRWRSSARPTNGKYKGSGLKLLPSGTRRQLSPPAFIVLPGVPFPVFRSLLRFRLSPPLPFEAPNKTSKVSPPPPYSSVGSHTAEDSGRVLFLSEARAMWKNGAEKSPGNRAKPR